MANDVGPSWFDTGTATVAASSKTVTFQGFGNLFDIVRPGDFFGTHVGMPTRIADVDKANNQVTLAYEWKGPAQTTAAYEIMLTPYIVAYRRAVQTILSLLNSGNVAALAGLTGEANTMPYFTGSGQMGRTPLSPLARTLIGRTDAANMRGDLNVAEQQFHNYDNTHGRGMNVGAFGLGRATDQRIGDFDALKGINQIQGGDSSTTNSPFGWAIVMNFSRQAERNAQIALNTANIPARMAIRNQDAGTEVMAPWSEVYHELNVRGSVSQSGGVPTGALFEYGSNGNGEYMRFADGTLICLSTGVTLTATCDNVRTSGVSAATSSGRPTWSFPATFSGIPVVSAETNGGSVTSLDRLAGVNGAPSATSVHLNAGDLSGGTTGTVDIACIAIGRWF